MQIKKREIKNKIIKSAKKEFLKHGFQGASIRTIVKNADTTTGNFYNYFDSKEDIFNEIVDKTYSKIIHFISNHKAKDEDPFVLNSLNSVIARKLVAGALSLITQSFIDNIILLSDYSEGTKYKNTKKELTYFIQKHFFEHASLINPDYKDSGIGLLISQQFIDGALSILKQSISTSKKIEIITEYLLFFAHGMVNLISGSKLNETKPTRRQNDSNKQS